MVTRDTSDYADSGATPRWNQRETAIFDTVGSEGAEFDAAGTNAGGQQSALQDTVGQVQQAAGEAVEQVQEKAGQVVDQLREQAGTRLEDQKHVLSEGLGTVASAIRKTSQQLREDEQAMVAQYADRAAEQIERVQQYLGDKELAQITGDLERFARREPVLFLGGGFLLGLMAVRFLKSSGRQAAASGNYSARHTGDSAPARAKVYGLPAGGATGGGAATWNTPAMSAGLGGATGLPTGAPGIDSPDPWRDSDATG